jgi:hypothetical protein
MKTEQDRISFFFVSGASDCHGVLVAYDVRRDPAGWSRLARIIGLNLTTRAGLQPTGKTLSLFNYFLSLTKSINAREAFFDTCMWVPGHGGKDARCQIRALLRFVSTLISSRSTNLPGAGRQVYPIPVRD